MSQEKIDVKAMEALEKNKSDIEDEKKRKRSELNSVSSSLDTSSLDTSTGENSTSVKQKKKKKKKDQKDSIREETFGEIEVQTLSKINNQLKDINEKLSKVITKDDGNLREIMRETFQQMKDEFLNSVYNRIDILEGKLFEKESENENLKQEVTKLETKLEEQKEKNNSLQSEIEKKEKQMQGRINELEQYSRKTSIRVDGIEEAPRESQYQTESKVLTTLNKYMPKLELRIEDIEIGHRLGKPKDPKIDKTPRQIIVQFCSRKTKSEIVRQRKLLKGSGIYVNEDLTRLNKHVLSCIRKKQQDEVESAWSREGRLFYKSKQGSIHGVMFEQFQEWIDLPWPQSKTPKTRNGAWGSSGATVVRLDTMKDNTN